MSVGNKGAADGLAAGDERPNVFLNYNQSELDAAYDQNVWSKDRAGAWHRRAEWSKQVERKLGGPIHAAYGPAPVEQINVFSPALEDAPVFILMHGGAWQHGTAADHSFAPRRPSGESSAEDDGPELILAASALRHFVIRRAGLRRASLHRRLSWTSNGTTSARA
jgi:hypothetical protein